MDIHDLAIMDRAFLGYKELRDRCLTLTVGEVREVALRTRTKGPSLKPVMSFAEKAKPVVLNKTNLQRLASAWGPETERWKGRKVEVAWDGGIRFGNETVGGVVVRPVMEGGGWDWTEAQRRIREAGMDPRAVADKLKELGHTAWDPKLTPLVQGMIAKGKEPGR